jgi:hypothetical protein
LNTTWESSSGQHDEALVLYTKGRIVNYHKIRRFVGENVVFRLDADVDFVVASASVLADVAAMNLRRKNATSKRCFSDFNCVVDTRRINATCKHDVKKQRQNATLKRIVKTQRQNAMLKRKVKTHVRVYR